MKPTLRTKLDSLVGRLDELNGLLASETATRDMEQFRKLSREHAELAAVVALYERWRRPSATPARRARWPPIPR